MTVAPEHMRVARTIIVLFLLVNLGLLMAHMLSLPGSLNWGWLTSSRVEKRAVFLVDGEPFEKSSWPARWGRNRPTNDRPHEILSEIEVRVQHQTRDGLVHVRVVGDSEAEVDSFINTLRSDFKRTYSTFDPASPISHTNSGWFHSSSEHATSTSFWRQKFLWLVIANVTVLSLFWLALRRVGEAGARPAHEHK